MLGVELDNECHLQGKEIGEMYENSLFFPYLMGVELVIFMFL